MARKPAHIIAANPKPSGRQAIWQAIRRVVEFSPSLIHTATDVPIRTITSYTAALTVGGYLERTRTAPLSKNHIYRLIRDVGVEAPRVRPDGTPVVQGLGREQMWRAMKMLSSSFSIHGLLIEASTADVGIAHGEATAYCRHLAQAGYLAVISRSPPIYRFIGAMATGPKAPMVQRTKCVFDPNLGKIVWHEEIDE